MDELLAQVSEQLGVPVDMLERSARARAAATGTTPEAIVAGWAGAPVPEAGAPAPVAAAEPAPAAPAPPVEEEQGLGVEVLEPLSVEDAAERQAEPEPEPEPEPVGPALPRWMTAAFVVIPFVAILYALSVPNGPDCGNSGRLDIDPVTGVAVNCDGSEYGSEDLDFFSQGQEIYEANCAACHGSTGGGGVGPALAGGEVVSTFSACTTHVEWVTVGSAGWPDATYGDTGKPVAGGMPGFAEILDSEEEIRAVVLYERVRFGDEDRAVSEVDCGLVLAGGGEETALARPSAEQ